MAQQLLEDLVVNVARLLCEESEKMEQLRVAMIVILIASERKVGRSDLIVERRRHSWRSVRASCSFHG
jgi:hypothetical protein